MTKTQAKNKKTYKYIVCSWCGGDLPKTRDYITQYCSKECRKYNPKILNGKLIK